VRCASCSVSNGILRQRDGRSNRRSQGWMERKGTLGHVRHANAFSCGRRKRDDEQGLTFPTSPEPSRALIESSQHVETAPKQLSLLKNQVVENGGPSGFFARALRSSSTLNLQRSSLFQHVSGGAWFWHLSLSEATH